MDGSVTMLAVCSTNWSVQTSNISMIGWIPPFSFCVRGTKPFWHELNMKQHFGYFRHKNWAGRCHTGHKLWSPGSSSSAGLTRPPPPLSNCECNCLGEYYHSDRVDRRLKDRPPKSLPFIFSRTQGNCFTRYCWILGDARLTSGAKNTMQMTVKFTWWLHSI